MGGRGNVRAGWFDQAPEQKGLTACMLRLRVREYANTPNMCCMLYCNTTMALKISDVLKITVFQLIDQLCSLCVSAGSCPDVRLLMYGLEMKIIHIL